MLPPTAETENAGRWNRGIA